MIVWLVVNRGIAVQVVAMTRGDLGLVVLVLGVAVAVLLVSGQGQLIFPFAASATLSVAGLLLALLAVIVFRLVTRSR